MDALDPATAAHAVLYGALKSGLNSAVAHPEIAAEELKVVAEVQRLRHALRRRERAERRVLRVGAALL